MHIFSLPTTLNSQAPQIDGREGEKYRGEHMDPEKQESTITILSVKKSFIPK